MGGSAPQLNVFGLRKSFEARTVLDVDVSLDQGDFCLMLGENGAGKSTFFAASLAWTTTRA